MCGRFTLVRLSDFLDEFPWILPPLSVPAGAGDGRYNIAPTQPVAAVMGGAAPRVQFVQWGLVPSWASDASGGGQRINARAETLGDKPSFRGLVASRRCLVVADGFYEWKPGAGKGGKQPFYVRLRSGRPFGLAGLWDRWRDPATGAELTTCTIITTEPNATIAALHNRMAVVVRPEDYPEWLSGGPLAPGRLAGMLSPYAEGEMEAFAVSTAVNRVSADGPLLVEPVEPGAAVMGQPSLF